jgi:hypothetical protein
MGKRKIDNFKLIENKIYRSVTYCKRKSGLIKKAIELSRLCGLNIYLMILDEDKKKLV